MIHGVVFFLHVLPHVDADVVVAVVVVVVLDLAFAWGALWLIK